MNEHSDCNVRETPVFLFTSNVYLHTLSNAMRFHTAGAEPYYLSSSSIPFALQPYYIIRDAPIYFWPRNSVRRRTLGVKFERPRSG